MTCLSLNQLLNLHLFVGIVFIENRYLYLLAAALLPLIFLALPGAQSVVAGASPGTTGCCAALSASRC